MWDFPMMDVGILKNIFIKNKNGTDKHSKKKFNVSKQGVK